jgi:PEP-CTERM motif
MSRTFRRSVSRFLLVFGIVVMGMAAPARADLEISLSTNGSTWTEVAHDVSGGGASYSNTNFSGFNISMLSDDSNSPGTPLLAYLEGAVTHIINNNKGTATLYIKLSDTGFTSPLTSAGPVLLDSQIGGSVTVGGADNTLTYQSEVTPTVGPSFTPGPQTPNITGTPRSYSTDAAEQITSGLTGTYSITECFKITLDHGSQFGFQSSTNLSYAPEPSSLALAALGAFGLAGYGVRRRARAAR